MKKKSHLDTVYTCKYCYICDSLPFRVSVEEEINKHGKETCLNKLTFEFQ